VQTLLRLCVHVYSGVQLEFTAAEKQRRCWRIEAVQGDARCRRRCLSSCPWYVPPGDFERLLAERAPTPCAMHDTSRRLHNY